MQNGKTSWPICKFLPGYFFVKKYSVLVRTSEDMRPLIANGEGISFYDFIGSDSLGDFTVTDPRDAVTFTLNDPYEGPSKRVKACKTDNTPITLEGYTPLQGVVAVLAGSQVVRTSKCLLGTLGVGDTVHIGTNEEFTIKSPITCEAITLDRPWPTNAGLKGDTPIMSYQIRWLYSGGLTKHSNGLDKVLSRNPKDGAERGTNENTAPEKKIILGYHLNGSLLIEFKCQDLSSNLCKAAAIGSNEPKIIKRDKFVIDIFNDKSKCCDTQDIHSCSSACRNSLSLMTQLNVQLSGKRIIYRVVYLNSGKAPGTRELPQHFKSGDLIS